MSFKSNRLDLKREISNFDWHQKWVFCIYYRKIILRVACWKYFRNILTLSIYRKNVCVFWSLNETPRWVCEETCKTLFLLKGGCCSLFILQLKITSWACLLGSALKFVFKWKANLLIFFRSSFNYLAKVFTSWATQNKDVSLAKSVTGGQIIRWIIDIN